MGNGTYIPQYQRDKESKDPYIPQYQRDEAEAKRNKEGYIPQYQRDEATAKKKKASKSGRRVGSTKTKSGW